MIAIKLVDARRGLNIKCRELFKDEKIAESIYRYLCDGIEECDNVEPELKVGEWIPVTERLPEEGAEVLAWTESGFSYVDWWLDGKWRVNSLVDIKYEHVTHWMPLPEPPKEETHDNN